jgi:hypothetical protein
VMMTGMMMTGAAVAGVDGFPAACLFSYRHPACSRLLNSIP